MLNTDSSNYNILATLAADVILLLIMLAGLFRIRLRTGSMSGFGLLLWKQVGWWRFSLIGCSLLTNVMFVLKGIIWILLAVAAEVPAAVRLCTLFAPLVFAHRYFTSQVLIFLNLNGMFCFSLAHR